MVTIFKLEPKLVYIFKNIYNILKSLQLGYVKLHSGQLYWGYMGENNMVNFPGGDIFKFDAHLCCFLVMTIFIYGVPGPD